MQPTLFSRRVTNQVYLLHAHNRVDWRLRWPYPRGDRRLTSSNTIRSKEPLASNPDRYFDTRSRRTRYTRLTVSSSKAVCCFYVNNSTARRFYYHTEHVHGGRREFHGGVKKTTSNLDWNREWKVLIPLYPRICCCQLTNRETRVRAHGLLQCFLSIKAYCWIKKNSERDFLGLRYNMTVSDITCKCVCGEKYTVCHVLSCKKGGFVAQRHDGVSNLLTSLIGNVCTNVDVQTTQNFSLQ